MSSKILTNNATWLIGLYLNVKRKFSKFYIAVKSQVWKLLVEEISLFDKWLKTAENVGAD